tara:strand:- start:456 stop:902 length:447 start_codon:yes stop_codon:yes gene_type:complete
MEPMTMIMLATSAVSAGGQILGGIGEKKSADLNAFNIETDKKLNKVQAMQESEARRAAYDLATASNIAAFAAMGRAQSDNSVQAFLKRQKEVFGEDIGRAQMQTAIESRKSDIAASTERRRGRNTLLASTISAAGTIGQGVMDYDRVR